MAHFVEVRFGGNVGALSADDDMIQLKVFGALGVQCAEPPADGDEFARSVAAVTMGLINEILSAPDFKLTVTNPVPLIQALSMRLGPALPELRCQVSSLSMRE
jgi:hypothetical protein